MEHPHFSKLRPFAVTLTLLVAMTAGAADLFNNWNKDTVTNGPTAPTVFTIASPAHVTELATYHWNQGRGLPPRPAVTIALKSAAGAVFGPFPAVGSAGQGGVPNVNWTATVSFDLPAGTYTVVDSEPTTWCQNGKSGGSGFALVSGSISAGGGASPGDPPPSPAVRGFEYAVKFVCGKPVLPVVAPGEYFTAINVHNPSPQTVSFRKKIAVALPGEKPGRISSFFPVQLKSDEALEIDCQDILRHAEETGFLKGFVVIETPLELDVVAVYTAGHPAVETMEIEHVKPRTSAVAVSPPSPSAAGYCPDGPPGAPIGNEYCCCNKPKPGGGFWPDCNAAAGLACYGNLSGPGIPANLYSTCIKGPFAPVEIHSSQPPYCGQKP